MWSAQSVQNERITIWHKNHWHLEVTPKNSAGVMVSHLQNTLVWFQTRVKHYWHDLEVQYPCVISQDRPERTNDHLVLKSLTSRGDIEKPSRCYGVALSGLFSTFENRVQRVIALPRSPPYGCDPTCFFQTNEWQFCSRSWKSEGDTMWYQRTQQVLWYRTFRIP